ncbi:CocE/NonD family hydrolase [Hominifimenecus sp. rT4P-3]|uniref:CocE/NonD family hydrolase n=1 Tax=Hominifimenecus sp. rT4P-3 TaxID=3242979 RepID=UPI003DA1CD64
MKNYYEGFQNEQSGEKKSSPGVYQGYSPKLYNGYEESSRYIMVRDGTKLAMELYRPTLDGVCVEEPLPVIWRFTPYGRVLRRPDGSIRHTAFFSGTGETVPDAYATGAAPGEPQTGAEIMLKEFTARGYIIASVDTRGKHASFGHTPAIQPIQGPEDAYDITEWLAAQPWCDGNIGMFGCSHVGATQMEAIRSNPPHLKAAFVGMTDYNKYDGWVRGGIPRETDWPDDWGKMNQALFQEERLKKVDVEQEAEWKSAIPVQEDSDGSMLKEAIRQHQMNHCFIPPLEDLDRSNPEMDKYYRLPYRDSFSNLTDNCYWEALSNSNYKEQINRSGVAVYLLGGWYDIWSRDTVIMYRNLELPKKMIIGPWFHMLPKLGFNVLVEQLRFYDYWLKGIQNHIMEEPPIYYNILPEKDAEWRFADQWPVPGVTWESFYLHSEGQKTVDSFHDGSLKEEPSAAWEEKDSFLSDYTVSDGECEPRDVIDLEQKGITYTSEILTEDVAVVGHPMLHLTVSTTGVDGDFFAFLLDVDEQGNSQIATEGMLRASMRSTETAPYDFLGLPWHPCREKDVKKLHPGKPVELVIDLKPTAQLFKKGHRIRLAITTSRSEYLFYREEPAPTVTIYHDARYSSYLYLPILP